MRAPKTLSIPVLLIAAALLLGGRTAKCQTVSTNMLNYTNITAAAATPITNNTFSVTIGNVYFPAISAHISDGGFAPPGTTNSIVVNQQVSFDGTNWFTIATWQPSITNAGYYVFAPSQNNETVYMRYDYVATNSVGLGINIP